jgi:transposase
LVDSIDPPSDTLNDSSTYYLNKLSTQEVPDIVQCSIHTICRLKKLWQKTGGVEKLRKRGGMPKSLDEYVEQAIVQIFLENVDITMEEALDWVEEEFKQRICWMTLSRLLLRIRVSYKLSVCRRATQSYTSRRLPNARGGLS